MSVRRKFLFIIFGREQFRVRQQGRAPVARHPGICGPCCAFQIDAAVLIPAPLPMQCPRAAI